MNKWFKIFIGTMIFGIVLFIGAHLLPDKYHIQKIGSSSVVGTLSATGAIIAIASFIMAFGYIEH